MRILVVSQYFWPENFRINELVAEWVKRGHQVTVLTGLPNYPEGKIFGNFRAAPETYSNYAGAHIVRVPVIARGRSKLRLVLNYFSFALTASLLGAWKLRGREMDVIFVFATSPVLVGIPSAFLRWLKRAPQVFWVLDLWPETLRAVGVVRSKWMLEAVGWLVGWIYAHCDLILAQSRGFIENIEKYAPAGRRIEYFPAWADGVFSATNVIPAPGVPDDRGAFTVLFAGNIGEAQDFPEILRAIEILRERRDIRWIVVGDGRLAGWVKQQVEARGLSDRVLMVGRHPLERMPSFFAHADALLVSLKDTEIFAMTIPGKLQSYLGSGIPVLAMLNGEGARLVEEANAGLVCHAGDGAGLASIVERMASMDDKTRRGLGENGRRLSEREFDRDCLFDRLDGFLAEMTRKVP